MSKQQSAISSGVSDQQAQDSVYDFLYHDARRVGSFLAQLDPDGHLQSLKTTTQASRSKQSTTGSKGGVNIGVAQATLDGKEQASAQRSDGADRTYDPLWANAVALLDYLQQRDLIGHSIRTANIGQFVLVTGHLKVMNLKMIDALLGNPDIPAAIGVNNILGLGTEDSGRTIAFALMRAFPHTIQAHIISSGDHPSASWMALDENSMVVSPANLMLNYGRWLEGSWSVLGIKDANVDRGMSLDDIAKEMQGDFAENAARNMTTPFGFFAELLAPAARHMMGRPGAYYGITPVLIFREVTAAAGS